MTEVEPEKEAAYGGAAEPPANTTIDLDELARLHREIDRLRAIEAAARLRRNVRFIGEDPPGWKCGEEWVAVPAADFEALRAALQAADSTEAGPPDVLEGGAG